MKTLNLFKEIETRKTVIEVSQPSTIREILTASKIVTEGENKDWGHKVIRPGFYSISFKGREVTFTPEIPIKH